MRRIKSETSQIKNTFSSIPPTVHLTLTKQQIANTYSTTCGANAYLIIMMMIVIIITDCCVCAWVLARATDVYGVPKAMNLPTHM